MCLGTDSLQIICSAGIFSKYASRTNNFNIYRLLIYSYKYTKHTNSDQCETLRHIS